MFKLRRRLLAGLVLAFAWSNGWKNSRVDLLSVSDKQGNNTALRSLENNFSYDDKLGAWDLLDESDLSNVTDILSGLSSFCLPWHVNSDAWWTHHPTFEVFHESDHKYCFREISDSDKAKLFQDIYEVQFESDCSTVLTKRMVCSGWGADLGEVVDGMMQTQVQKLPFTVYDKWHYAWPKPHDDPDQKVCDTADMFCYFLPLTRCEPQLENRKEGYWNYLEASGIHFPRKTPNRWYYEYITRPQTWLRKRVYDFLQSQPDIEQPCSVVHVRRADVVLHGESSRRYYPIADYLNTSDSIENNILLLTDDHNAIGEALHEFPDRNWIFINRTRYRGNEGGWERQTPSNDPIFETVTLVSLLKMVQGCSSIVKSSSNLGTVIYGMMLEANSSVPEFNVDNHEGSRSIENQKYVNVSKAYDRRILIVHES